MKIGGILFDFGGVLVKGTLEAFFARVEPVVGIHIKQFDNTSMVPEFAKGLIDARTCFERLFQCKLSNNTFERIIKVFSTNWQQDPKMFELVYALKKQGFKLGVLSNSDPINAPIFRAQGLYDPFDAVTLSHEVGFVKPEPEIYEIAVKRLGTQKDNTLFIDDLSICIDGARKVGILGIQFTGKQTLINNLASYNILV